MRCEVCGHQEPALKTVCLRSDATRTAILCDGCWLPLRGRVWIIPGQPPCFGTCRSCGGWFSVRDLSEVTGGGGKWGAPTGACEDCA